MRKTNVVQTSYNCKLKQTNASQYLVMMLSLTQLT